METKGPFKIYFNHHQAAPLVWCIAKDNWEIAVHRIHINAFCETRYSNKQIPDSEDGKPSAWLWVEYGTLSVDDSGIAYVTN